MAMTSSLGTDALIPTHLVAHEEISQPFNFEITAVSQIGVIDPNDILNLAVCLILQEGGAAVRYFHGIVRQIRSNGIQRGKTAADTFQNYTLDRGAAAVVPGSKPSTAGSIRTRRPRTSSRRCSATPG